MNPGSTAQQPDLTNGKKMRKGTKMSARLALFEVKSLCVLHNMLRSFYQLYEQKHGHQNFVIT